MADPTPKVIVIAGPNGAGKSTLAPFLLRDTLGLMEYVNADTVALGLSAFQPETVAFEAGRIMLKRLHDLAKRRASFAFETTLASRSYAPWINSIRQQGYSFHLLFLWLRSPEIAIQRVKERARMGGHNIPEDIIRRRYNRGIRNFFEFYQSLANTWVVYDNSESGEPIAIARGIEGAAPDISESDLWLKFCEAK
ncbi:MAG TPA: zeta toxin family protein [Blastocatellia bacterium]|nr:zeta toxin family protein [Blastocatellia bacterium]